jgi:hypothetical protein
MKSDFEDFEKVSHGPFLSGHRSQIASFPERSLAAFKEQVAQATD